MLIPRNQYKPTLSELHMDNIMKGIKQFHMLNQDILISIYATLITLLLLLLVNIIGLDNFLYVSNKY